MKNKIRGEKGALFLLTRLTIAGQNQTYWLEYYRDENEAVWRTGKGTKFQKYGLDGKMDMHKRGDSITCSCAGHCE